MNLNKKQYDIFQDNVQGGEWLRQRKIQIQADVSGRNCDKQDEKNKVLMST